MLRESAIAFRYQFDPRTIADPTVPMHIPGGEVLRRFVDALLRRCGTSLETARNDVLRDLGPDALVDACSVFGNFEMMNRVAEGTGIPISPHEIERRADLIEMLGLANP
ncbi:hypothetical protein MNBD_ACTINO01-966 [hydrothermal vent metagenome]|uniref:Uncharacterized protein n=1 Tax=hydrothermal vent metagenome TaxID=652676 RepID=A0A3B0SWE1_9ZZZZ